jgi:hypothetical protein
VFAVQVLRNAYRNTVLEVKPLPNPQVRRLNPLAPDHDQFAPLPPQPPLDDQLHRVVTHRLVVELEVSADLFHLAGSFSTVFSDYNNRA